MNKSQPIKNKEKLDRFKNFYIEEEYNPRNYMFISLGLNTALRVSDLLKFTWNDVYNFDNGCFRTHVKLIEQKTTKQSVIFLMSSSSPKYCFSSFSGSISPNSKLQIVPPL